MMMIGSLGWSNAFELSFPTKQLFGIIRTRETFVDQHHVRIDLPLRPEIVADLHYSIST